VGDGSALAGVSGGETGSAADGRGATGCEQRREGRSWAGRSAQPSNNTSKIVRKDPVMMRVGVSRWIFRCPILDPSATGS